MIRTAAALVVMIGCATPDSGERVIIDDSAPSPRPARKGDPEPVYEFEPGPVISDRAALSSWLEENRGRRLRLPIVLEAGERGLTRSRVGDIDLLTTDLALGIPLRERVAQRCGRSATRCALWLEGRYGEKPHFEDARQQFEVLEVGEIVDETAELKAERVR